MKCAIVDERISSLCEQTLIRLGFSLIKLPPSKKLPAPMASHADMLLFSNEKRIIASAEYFHDNRDVFSDIRRLSPNTEIHLSSNSFGNKYPHDRIFNSLVIKNDIFMKAVGISESIIEYANEKGLNIVKVNQGYPACTTLAFGGSAITSDEGMAKALSERGVKVTLISNGDISLPPYEYGFIGGAAGVYKKEIFFLGNVTRHRDYEKIDAAIRYEGYTHISLSDEGLSDLGKIIFLD